MSGKKSFTMDGRGSGRQGKPLRYPTPRGLTIPDPVQVAENIDGFLKLAPLVDMLTRRLGGGFSITSAKGEELYVSGGYAKFVSTGEAFSCEIIPLTLEDGLLMLELAMSPNYERKIEDLTQSAFVGEVSVGAFHDMNNMLCVIGPSMEILSSKISKYRKLIAQEDMEAIESTISDIQRAFDLATQICRRIQSIGSKKKEISVINVKRVIECAIKLAKKPIIEEEGTNDKQIDLTSDVDENIFVNAVESEVQMCLHNLIINAAKHGIASGTSGTIHITAVETGKYVSIDVSNTGREVPLEIRDSLLVAPLTSNCDTGFGLYTATQNIKNLGGDVSFTSKPGDTVFTVKLPSSPPPSIAMDMGDITIG